jgi:hypothetical protein
MSRGIQVKEGYQNLVEFGCEDIRLHGGTGDDDKLDDDDVKEVLDALMQGKFTRVKRIILVSSAAAMLVFVVFIIVHT